MINEDLLNKSEEAQRKLKEIDAIYGKRLSKKGLQFDYEFMKQHSQIFSLNDLIKKYPNQWVKSLKMNNQMIFAYEEDFLSIDIKADVTDDFEELLLDNRYDIGTYYYLEDSEEEKYYYLWIDTNIEKVIDYLDYINWGDNELIQDIPKGGYIDLFIN